MSNIIKGYRNMAGFTQKEMAGKLNISEGTYRNKEKGKVSFKDNEIKTFSDLVNKVNPSVTIDEIFFTKKPTQTDALEVRRC